ncbi:MAG TPA: hypothetical protein VFH45_02120 [Acidimicrobiales bacterium]|nr:hypothetical protein [Acidimicrobiales bacterium]
MTRRALGRAATWIGGGQLSRRRRRSRVGAAAASGLGLSMLAVASVGMAAASANAPNPIQQVTGGVQSNTDGSATVTLHGNWSWDTLSASDDNGSTKSSPQLACQGRYGVGWAVDWWGTDAAHPSFSIQNDAYNQVGATQNPAVPFAAGSSTPGYSGPITEVATAGLPLSKVGAPGVFWVGGAAAGVAPGYAGGTNAVYDGFAAPLCATTAADGAPIGTWSAQATYPSINDVPRVLCVNFYDMHGKEGQPSKAGGSDWSPAKDGDNSIQTNSYNPQLGANCFATPGLQPQTPTITVDKTNNAAGTGYGKTEQAPVPGADVPFRVTVTNQSSFPVVIQSITDAWSNQSIQPTCTQSFLGQTLAAAGQAGDSATCDFTLQNYAPPAGQSLVDTATVVAVVSGSSNSAAGSSASSTSASSTSTVTTPSQGVSGAILMCSGNMPSTTLVPGGALSVSDSSGTQLASSNDQLPVTSVPAAGDYTLSATAPHGYQFDGCGQSGVSIDNPPTTASQTLSVPAGSVVNGDFYVTPVAPKSTIAGSILSCVSGAPSSSQVPGGALTVTNADGHSVMTSHDQLPASPVDAGTYTVGADAPAGYQFVDCGQSGVTIGSPATSASQGVVVPDNGSATAVFYVAPVPVKTVPTQTLAGSILACGTDGTPTQTPVAGGSLTALSAAGQQVASSPDRLSAVSVAAGDYNVDATAPSGYTFVACGQSGPVIGTPATTASDAVSVPQGGAGVATFYVTPIPTQVLGETFTAPTPPAAPAGAPTAVAPASLAFTGTPPMLRIILLFGLSLLSGGSFLLWVTRPRQAWVTRKP